MVSHSISKRFARAAHPDQEAGTIVACAHVFGIDFCCFVEITQRSLQIPGPAGDACKQCEDVRRRRIDLHRALGHRASFLELSFQVVDAGTQPDQLRVIGSEGEPLFIVTLRVLQASSLVVPDAAHDQRFYARRLVAVRIGNSGTTHRADIRLAVVDGAFGAGRCSLRWRRRTGEDASESRKSNPALRVDANPQHERRPKAARGTLCVAPLRFAQHAWLIRLSASSP